MSNLDAEIFDYWLNDIADVLNFLLFSVAYCFLLFSVAYGIKIYIASYV